MSSRVLRPSPPASGFVGPVGGLILGAVSGVLCYLAVDLVKGKWKIDDSLDVFAVHGVGGVLGTLLVSVLAVDGLGGVGVSVSNGNVGTQLGVQALGVLATLAWSGGFTFIIVKVVARLTGGLRVSAEDEAAGLDLVHPRRTGLRLVNTKPPWIPTKVGCSTKRSGSTCRCESDPLGCGMVSR